MKTQDEVIALAVAHGAVVHEDSARLIFDYERLQTFAAACALTHEQAYAIQCKAHFEACRIPPEDRLQVFAAACAEPAVQTDLKFNPSWCYGCTPDNCPGCKRPAVQAQAVHSDHKRLIAQNTETSAEYWKAYAEDLADSFEEMRRAWLALRDAPKPPAVPAAPMTVTDEDIAQAYVDFKTIKNDVSHDMRFVLKAFVTRKGNPK